LKVDATKLGPLLRHTSLTHGLNPLGSLINDIVNSNREKFDRFAYSIINKLDSALQNDILSVKCKKMRAANLTSERISDITDGHNAIFLKGGSAYHAYDRELAKSAPRTHDFDFTICCESIDDVHSSQLQDFFWTAVHESEQYLELDTLPFVKIERTVSRRECHHRNEKTILTGPADSRGVRSFGGPSDYLALTILSNPKKQYANYRVNVFLPKGREGSGLSMYHLVEFIFTTSATESDYAGVIYRVERPHFSIPLLDVTSLVRYSIYAMLNRGLDKRLWRKARQDYARIVHFIDSVQATSSMREVVDSHWWRTAVSTFHFVSLHLPHCSADGYNSIDVGDAYFAANFKFVETNNLNWWVLNEIGFEREAIPFKADSLPTIPSLLPPSSSLCYTRTPKFWVISSIREPYTAPLPGAQESCYDFYS